MRDTGARDQFEEYFRRAASAAANCVDYDPAFTTLDQTDVRRPSLPVFTLCDLDPDRDLVDPRRSPGTANGRGLPRQRSSSEGAHKHGYRRRQKEQRQQQIQQYLTVNNPYPVVEHHLQHLQNRDPSPHQQLQHQYLSVSERQQEILQLSDHSLHHQQQQQNGEMADERHIVMHKVHSNEEEGGSRERVHSAPQSRSSSWRKGMRPSRSGMVGGKRPSLGGESLSRGARQLGAGKRRESEPLERVVSDKLAELRVKYEEEDMCVVRHFASCKGKGKGKARCGAVICRGDSFKKRSGGDLNTSNNNNNNNNSSPTGEERRPSTAEERRASFGHSRTGGGGDVTGEGVKGTDSPHFRVLVLGDQGVGKTALIQQFMTSEYLGAVETSTDEYSNEKTLSVLLDGKETMIDVTEVSVNKNIRDYDDVDAYVVVFSIADRGSYQYAMLLLQDIEVERSATGRQPAVILVGNKSDIVRSRQVMADEVHEICCRYRCKMIDLSASLNHRVDELLVGIVQQVHLHYDNQVADDVNGVSGEGQGQDGETGSSRKRSSSLRSAAKGLVQRLWRRKSLRAWQPDNLQTL